MVSDVSMHLRCDFTRFVCDACRSAAQLTRIAHRFFDSRSVGVEKRPSLRTSH